MRNRIFATVAILAAVGVVGPAQAAKPDHAKGPKPNSHKPDKPKPKCDARNVGYNASGTLVSATLTPTTDGRYNGTLEVTLTRANHHAPTGAQTFTLTNARVKFHKGVDATAPAPGGRVRLHGKITRLPKKCPADGFTPAITIKKVDIHKAKA